MISSGSAARPVENMERASGPIVAFTPWFPVLDKRFAVQCRRRS